MDHAISPQLGRRGPLRNCRYQEFRDPSALHRAYQTLSTQTQAFINLVPERQFCHWVGSLRVNDLPLVPGNVTRTRASLGESPDLLLIAIAEGVLDVSTRGGTCHCPAHSIVLTPIADLELEVSGERCAIRLHPREIAKTAAAMAGRRSGMILPAQQQFHPFSPVARQGGHPQASGLHGLIRTIDACFAVGPQVAMRLGLDDQIQRMAASLLQPELLTEEPGDLGRLRERSGKDAFDLLIDYIRANLNAPLRLSDLEARSYYSRRSLQYAFQERLGCSPKQWIREQRLVLALEQLQAEGKRPTIKSVALACGYLHQAHFARDFKRRYGMTPLQASRL